MDHLILVTIFGGDFFGLNAYTLDFPYELEQRYKKMHREDYNYCEFMYECLYEEGIAIYNELSDTEFKKLIWKHYDYINEIAKEVFY